MKIRLLHGIHSVEGDNNMTALAPHMERAMPKADIDVWQYGFMGFWKARWDNINVAQDFAATSKFARRHGEPEIWITHSNGAAVAYLAVTKFGAMPDGIININPALDRWRTAPVPWVETIHSDCDRAVWLSQWLPFHIWGDQGKVGYKGRMRNTINHNATRFTGNMRYEGHMGLFGAPRIADWATFMAHRIGERLVMA